MVKFDSLKNINLSIIELKLDIYRGFNRNLFHNFRLENKKTTQKNNLETGSETIILLFVFQTNMSPIDE